ncbi:unnamed protein product, partial [Scytosiphon promiscuus]
MSTERDKQVLASALETLDKEMKRTSPFFDDLQAVVDGELFCCCCGRFGKSAHKREDGEIPGGAVLALRGASKLVDVKRGPNQTFKYGQVEYKVDDLLAVIEDEDRRERDVAGRNMPGGGDAAEVDGGGATGVGSTEGGSAEVGGGDSTGASGHARGAGAGPTERKGPHCLMRLVGLLVEPDMRPRLIASGQQATRQQLDASDVGSSSMWRTLAERFRDPDYKVARIVDHPAVSHCNPNIIHQPNITPEKLRDMWKTAKAKWNTPHMHWSSDSGNHQPWISFCQGDG